MQRVVRLVTIADVREDVDAGRISVSARYESAVDDGSRPLPVEDHGWAAAPIGAGEDVDPRRVSVSARHEAVMEDGSRLLLLDDRGWTEELRGPGANEIDDLWALTSESDIAETARLVVGPDAPFGAHSQDDMETDHWNALVETLRGHGVVVDASELRQLPHDVVLSDRLLARLGPGPGDAA
jgi:hypothetical protein